MKSLCYIMNDKQKIIELLTELKFSDSDDDLSDDRKFSINQLLSLSPDELYKHGCGLWDDSGLVLITKRILNILKSGEQLLSISGNNAVIGKDYIDDDTRGGCLAFGFIHPSAKINQ